MKQILFKLGLFSNEASRVPSERVLQAALELLYVADIEWLKMHPETPGIYQAGVRYQREIVPAEIWKTPPYCIEDGVLDCEDAACWRSAELYVRHGIDARPAFTFKKIGNLSLYHIVVKLPDGTIEDPSKKLGMR